MEELQAEREAALARLGEQPMADQPPRVDAETLTRHVRDIRHALQHATNEEKRELTRQFVDGVILCPDAREVEIRVKLPGAAVQRVEAAARIVLFNKVLATAARLRLRYLSGRGRVKPYVSRVISS